MTAGSRNRPGSQSTGYRLWFVDAETSSLRTIDLAGQLRTYVGEGLFDFGLVDGPRTAARLQHPLGVAVLDEEEFQKLLEG